jgi:flagellar hook-basal body complex protein FliE
MNTIEPNAQMRKLLDDMRSLRLEAMRNNVIPTEHIEKTPVSSFGSLLSSAVKSVNDIQKQSSDLQVAFQRGEPGIDIAQVMMTSQKAGIAFQAAAQVRNKFVEAYKEIMNMPI